MGVRLLLTVLVGLIGCFPVWASTSGSISGTVTDPTGAVIAGATVTATEVDTGIAQTVKTNSVGAYTFPELPIGRYDVTVTNPGFKVYKLAGLKVDANSFIRVDAALLTGAESQQVVVDATAAQADLNTENAQMGNIIGGRSMLDMPLESRSFTDLFAFQTGVVPQNSGQENYGDTGDFSVSGGRENFNGFMVNGANVEESDSNGISIIPNIDSLQEYRILTNNTNAEYGNYAGGIVNVVTKSGTNHFHGDVFEFLRNTDLDAAGYYNPTRAVYHQNIYGGTVGGPIFKDKLFFFADFQGTRTSEGASSGLVHVPSTAELSGDFSADGAAGAFDSGGCSYPGASGTCVQTVSGVGTTGSGYEQLLSTRLGYTVANGEPYYYRAGDVNPTTGGAYSSNCTSSNECVMPGGQFPTKAWDPAAAGILGLVSKYPATVTVGGLPYYLAEAAPSPTNDNKGGIRLDYKSRIGLLSAYYAQDGTVSTSLYGASSFPGYPYKSASQSNLLVVSDATPFGSSAVNLFTASAMRAYSASATPAGGLGVSAQSLGWAAPSAGGLDSTWGPYGGTPLLYTNSWSIGESWQPTVDADANYQVQDGFSKLIGTHEFKFGVDYHIDQENRSTLAFANGFFGESGAVTGLDIGDMVTGAADTFYQATVDSGYPRDYYLGLYAQDTWRATPDLSLDYGLRWEAMPFWAQKNNENPLMIPGMQSQLFPTAPLGYLFPGDPGTYTHFTPFRNHNFAPRIGLAYAPGGDGPLSKLFGGKGNTSIRAGYGVYYSAVEGTSTSNTIGAAPYGLFWGNPTTVNLFEPFVAQSTQASEGQHFPVPPPTGTNVDWTFFEPITSTDAVYQNDRNPYLESFDLSIQRKIGGNNLATISYVGSMGHHLLSDLDNNPGVPSLCAALSNPNNVEPGTPTCAQNDENGTFYPTGASGINNGQPVHGTRGPFGDLFGGNGWLETIGYSSYNALEADLRHTSDRLYLDFGYTYSQSMDDSSGYGDQVNPYAPQLSKGLSAFDMKQYFYGMWSYELPFDQLFGGGPERLTRGWKFAGNAQFSTGLPVTITEDDDNSLEGNNDTGPNGGSTDEPNFTPGHLFANRNPRSGQAYFNTSLFTPEKFGQQGLARRRFFTGPGIDNWNLTILKDVKLREASNLEIRGEFFNAFNHAQWNASEVNGNINSGSSFGLVTGAASGRIIQLASKITF